MTTDNRVFVIGVGMTKFERCDKDARELGRAGCCRRATPSAPPAWRSAPSLPGSCVAKRRSARSTG